MCTSERETERECVCVHRIVCAMERKEKERYWKRIDELPTEICIYIIYKHKYVYVIRHLVPFICFNLSVSQFLRSCRLYRVNVDPVYN